MRRTSEIRILAQNYMLDGPTGWFSFASSASQEMAKQLSIRVNTLTENVSSEITQGIEDTLLALLLSPETVKVLCALENDKFANEWLCEELSESLSTLSLTEREESDDYWDDIVDLVEGRDDGIKARPIYRWYDYTYLSAPSLLSVFRVNKVDFRNFPIKDCLKHALGKSSDIIHLDFSEYPRLIRFDAIDKALYDALIKKPDLNKALNWRVFEELLADILKRFGYEVELQQGTKDGGIDIIALVKSTPLGRHRYLLQAKRSVNRIGVEPVRQLLFLHQYHHATKSCLATTAEFTKGALELARQYPWQLELRDGKGIQEWIKQAAVISI